MPTSLPAGLRLVLALLLGPQLAPWARAGEPFRATVVSIGDGDTIRVLQAERRITVRLACIDAPEMDQAPDGERARRFLQTRLPLGTSVTLRPQTIDRFGRTVAEVIHGGNLNLALVEEGLVFVYRKYLSQCNATAYLDAEVRANRRRTGVWTVPGGLKRPWEFRRSRPPKRSSQARQAGTVTRRYRCSEIGSFQQAQRLLLQGHTYLDRDGNGQACESLR